MSSVRNNLGFSSRPLTPPAHLAFVGQGRTATPSRFGSITLFAVKLKTLLVAVGLAFAPYAIQAAVYSDSRVLSCAEMAQLGVNIRVGFGAESGYGMQVWVSILPSGEGRVYRSMEYAVLVREPDADFSSTDPVKSGIRDSKDWAKEVRGDSTEKTLWSFRLSEQEIPRTYLVVRFSLPPKNDMRGFGRFYFLPRELRKGANLAAQSTPPGQDTREP
jgi:hypothetical protein